MSRRRFHAPIEAFADGCDSVMLAPEEARHLRDVLRLSRGDEVFVFDGEGREYRCIVEEYGRDGAKLSVSEEVEPARPESKLQLTLAVALLKGEKFDLVVQKATELGVTRIVPLITKLADVRLRDVPDAVRRVARWQRIAVETAKQCGRARVTEISSPVKFDLFVREGAHNSEQCLMFSERDGQSLSATIKQWSSAQPTSLCAFIGSEGGWTNEEIAQARDEGWQIVTLGGRTLRAETAAITVIALLQHLSGDLD